MTLYHGSGRLFDKFDLGPRDVKGIAHEKCIAQML